jgi:hypothetical protein
LKFKRESTGFVDPSASLGISAARISSQLRHASQKVVEGFYRASFGGFQVFPEEVRELRRHLERAGAS